MVPRTRRELFSTKINRPGTILALNHSDPRLDRLSHVVELERGELLGVSSFVLPGTRRDGCPRAALRHHALRPARGVFVRGQSQRLEEAQARARAGRGSVLSVANGAARPHPASSALRGRGDGQKHRALRKGGVRLCEQDKPRHALVHARRLRRAFDDGGPRAAARVHIFFCLVARRLRPRHARVHSRPGSRPRVGARSVRACVSRKPRLIVGVAQSVLEF